MTDKDELGMKLALARGQARAWIERADALVLAISTAADELESEHRPLWSDPLNKLNREPIGCEICFPSDGSWPCASRLIADDLRAVLQS